MSNQLMFLRKHQDYEGDKILVCTSSALHKKIKNDISWKRTESYITSFSQCQRYQILNKYYTTLLSLKTNLFFVCDVII